MLFIMVTISAVYYETTMYLFQQARGQAHVILNTTTIQNFSEKRNLTEQQKRALLLIERIKKYSVDSLGYAPTKNYTTIYDQKGAPVLWVVTASLSYELSPYYWNFPLLGKLSYKGYFRKELAIKEYNRLKTQGYDAELRPVSAWSTLGWLNDPVLSSMLDRSDGGLSNLLFHELFHASFFASNNVDLNENLASFIAHKATLRFLAKDTAALNLYIQRYQDEAIYSSYMLRQRKQLSAFYTGICKHPNRFLLKQVRLVAIADSIKWLPLKDKNRYLARRVDILKNMNASFIDLQQYDAMQDSLDAVFNIIYKGDIKKMVQDLRSN